MTAKLLSRFKRRISRLTLVPSDGGRFELSVGGHLIYSKAVTGRFPDEEQIIEEVGTLLGR